MSTSRLAQLLGIDVALSKVEEGKTRTIIILGIEDDDSGETDGHVWHAIVGDTSNHDEIRDVAGCFAQAVEDGLLEG